MQKDSSYLCSELVKLTAGRSVIVGNLEQICEGSCTVTLEEPLAIGTQVRMHCVACPLGKKTCAECHFRGKVLRGERDSALGCLLEIEFEGRTWSTEEWLPSHLTNVELVMPARAKPGERGARLVSAASHG